MTSRNISSCYIPVNHILESLFVFHEAITGESFTGTIPGSYPLGVPKVDAHRPPIANNIFTLRSATKMTQEQFADTYGFGQAAMSKWESGEIEPKAKNLLRLAVVFRVDVYRLLEGVDISYDSLVTDLPRHTPSVKLRAKGGPADVPAPARVLEEKRKNQRLRTHIKKIAAELLELTQEDARPKTGAGKKSATKTGRGDRAVGE